jgi:succinyl-diaminopimelate desuccinylase
MLIGTKYGLESDIHLVALVAHVDVVPGKPELFTLRVEGDKAFGRGVSDMKFAVPLFLQVMKDLPPEYRDNVLIVITFDEEVGGMNSMRPLVEDFGFRPSAVFLPDGGDNFHLVTEQKGALKIRLTATGVAGHASRPWLCENALDKAIAIYQDIRNVFPLAKGPEEWANTINLGCLNGGIKVNQLPDKAEALLEVRYTEGTGEEVFAQIKAVVGNRAECNLELDVVRFHLDEASPYHALILDCAKRHDQTLTPLRETGASDGRFFSKHGIPVIITKPICGGQHADSEWLNLSSLDVYYAILLDFVNRATG